MFGLYRRHQKHCPHLFKGREHLRCPCPLWIDGRMNGERIHRALGTTDWQKAQQIVREWEADGGLVPGHLRPPQRMTLEEAWQRFLADLGARNLHTSTVRKYRLLSRQMTEFACQHRLRFLQQFDLPALSEFRATWHESPLTRSKKLERFALSSVLLKRALGWTKIQRANLKDRKCRFAPRCRLHGKRWSGSWELWTRT